MTESNDGRTSLYVMIFSIALTRTDMNECAMNRDTCLEGQICENTVGSYVCRRNVNCGTGYTLDQLTQQCVGGYSVLKYELNVLVNELTKRVDGAYVKDKEHNL